MIDITNAASFDRALAAPIAPEIKRLLVKRRDQLLTDTHGEYALAELAQFIVVEPPDKIAQIEAAAAYPVITEASFEWVVDHGGVFEAATILSDDGFSVVLIVPDDDRIAPELLALLRDLAGPQQPTSVGHDHRGASTAP